MLGLATTLESDSMLMSMMSDVVGSRACTGTST